MLTKQDLEAIRGIVRDEARIAVKEELRPVKKELQKPGKESKGRKPY